MRSASVKETHQFQDKYVETVNTVTESVKDLVETYSIEKLLQVASNTRFWKPVTRDN